MSRPSLTKRIRFFLRSLNYYYAWNRRLYKIGYPPFVISIEPTNYCNLRCTMCPQSEERKIEFGFMSMDIYRKIIDEIRHYAREVILNIGGEPFLHRDLPEMVHYASDAGLYVHFDTNAMLLKPELSRALITAGLDEITFSFDSADPKEYEAIRRGAKYDQVVGNIREFLAIKQELEATAKVVLQSIRRYQPNQPKEVGESYRALFTGMPVDEFRLVWAHDWAGTLAHDKNYTLPAPITTIHQRPTTNDQHYHPCRLLWKNLAVSWDGKVYLCCFDLNRQDLIGDIKDNTLLEIWHGDKMTARRIRLVEGVNDHCGICNQCSMLYEHSDQQPRGLKKFVRDLLRRNG